MTFKTGDRLMNLEQVIDRVGMKRSTIYTMMADGQFPKPVKVGRMKYRNAWIEREISTYIQERIKERDTVNVR